MDKTSMEPANQIAQPGTKPLERTVGPGYNLKYTPYQTSLMEKLGLQPQESEAMAQQAQMMADQQAQQAARTGAPQGRATIYGTTLDNMLLERLKQSMGVQQQPTQPQG